MKQSTQNFFTCMLLRFILPLIPVWVAHSASGGISLRSLTLALSIYVITQGLATKHLLTFSVSLLVGILFMVEYGSIDAATVAGPLTSHMQVYIVAGLLIVHGIERFIRHVKDFEPFFLFNTQNAKELT